MKFVDTHAHFDARAGEDGYAAAIDRARAAGVARIIAIGGTEAMNNAALACAAEWPELVQAAIGYDRDLAAALSTTTALAAAIDRLRDALAREAARVVAIGETGLDYYYGPDTKPRQVALFRAQAVLARELDLPLVVHSRESDADTLDVLRDAGSRGVLHCFTGGEAFAESLLELGFFIGFSGIVSFRNADALRAVARRVPADRLLIETDSPFLAPVPVRGRRNEPAYVRYVAEALAAARGETVDAIARIAATNAATLFGDVSVDRAVRAGT
jgi:TatD DNase family protein